MNCRWLPVAVLALLTLTAGCAGVFGGERAAELTPVPDIETPAPGVPAPDQSGSTRADIDTEQLLAADGRIRNGTNYTLERTVRIDAPAGTLVIDQVRRVASDGRAVEHLRVNSTGSLSLVVESGTLWTNGTTTRTRTRLSDGRSGKNSPLGGYPEPFGSATDLAGHILRSGQFDVRARQGGAQLESSRPFSMNLGDLPLATGPAENASATLLVTEDGLIDEFVLRYDSEFGGGAATVTINHRIVDRGTTTVSRPGWV